MGRHGSRYPKLTGNVARYLTSFAGVAAVTWLISLLLPRYRVGNISMVYLLLVLALAVFAGSGPAIAASVLAFLAFDWFFVQPVGHFTVTDPDEWLALFLFLVVAIITGQLAAGLRRRAEEARRREREISTLYELSTAILGHARPAHVLTVIVERLQAALNLRSATIFIRTADGRLDPVAEAGKALEEAERQDLITGAHWTMEAGTAIGRFNFGGANSASRVMRPLDDDYVTRRAGAERLLATFVPLVLGEERLGVMAVISEPPYQPLGAESMRLLNAFAAQTALAIGRARLTQEEERARAAAESERLKSVFLASISHDLRTPLTAIRTAAAALRREHGDLSDPAHRELAAGIDQEAERLNRLVDNVLEMSRIEAGGLPLHKQPEEIAETIGTAAHRLSHLLAPYRLRVEIPDDLPLVPLDAVQIDRVLANLLENAAKFARPGTEISIRAWREREQVCIAVDNAGIPILASELDRIFDKFHRLTTSAANGRGTGLGLAICRGVVEAHGGRIRAENVAGGVRFSFSLPLSAENPIPRPSDAPATIPAQVLP